jgi:hypothetical protein
MGFAFGLLCLLATAPLGGDPGKDVPSAGIVALLSGAPVDQGQFQKVANLHGTYGCVQRASVSNECPAVFPTG